MRHVVINGEITNSEDKQFYMLLFVLAVSIIVYFVSLLTAVRHREEGHSNLYYLLLSMAGLLD
jgi:heme/copper-type cytochrome/quinol oxidase subunit 2